MFVGVHVEECVCQSADQSFRPGCNGAYGGLIDSINCLPVKAKLQRLNNAVSTSMQFEVYTLAMVFYIFLQISLIAMRR